MQYTIQNEVFTVVIDSKGAELSSMKSRASGTEYVWQADPEIWARHAPILFPIAMQLGIDPIHLGIIMVVNMEIGLITPPTGLNLFVTSAVTGMPLTRVVRAVSPWLLVMLAFLILVTYVPFISLGLPNFLGMN